MPIRPSAKGERLAPPFRVAFVEHVTNIQDYPCQATMTPLSRVVVSPLDDADNSTTTLHPMTCAGSFCVSERARVTKVSVSLKFLAPSFRCNSCRRKTADEAMNFDPQSGRLGQRELMANPASYRVVGTESAHARAAVPHAVSRLRISLRLIFEVAVGKQPPQDRQVSRSSQTAMPLGAGGG